MALLSNYNRYNGQTARIVAFGGDKFILDGVAYDKDFNTISKSPIDIPGLKNEMLIGRPSLFFRRAGWGSVAYNHYQKDHDMLDVSLDNPIFGKTYAVDPYDTNITYSLQKTNVHAGSGYMTMTKINNRDGSVIHHANVPVTQYYQVCRILDITEDAILLVGVYQYSGYYNAYYSKIDKNTFTTKSNHIGTVQYGFQQILNRGNKKIQLFQPYDGKVYNLDYSTNTLTYTVMSKADSNVRDLVGRAYNTTYGTNMTPKMGNGWHYRLAARTNTVNTDVKFEAITYDTETNTYRTLHDEEIAVVIDDRCDPEAVKMKINNSNTTGNNMFWTYKLDSEHVLIIYTYDETQTDITGMVNGGYKSRWMLCKIPADTPNRIEVKNAQILEYGYTGKPIRGDNDKFLLVLQDTATHCYKPDLRNYELNRTWEIPTPFISMASWYNGMFWWINSTTNEVNIEVEGNAKLIKLVADNDNFFLANEEDVQETTVHVSVLNTDGDLLRETIELGIYGPARFKDGATKTKTVNTSNSNVTDLVIEVTGAGKIVFTAKIRERG